MLRDSPNELASARVDGNLTLNDLFAKGPIEITLLGGNGRRVKMGIEAPPELCILRVDKDAAAG